MVAEVDALTGASWGEVSAERVNQRNGYRAHRGSQLDRQEGQAGGGRLQVTKWARAAALRCRGMLEADHDLLCEAVCVLRGSPRPLERATACEEAASALRDVAQTTKATALLDEALGIYVELGAARDIARVEAALRSLGRCPSRRGWRQRQAKVGWEALTRTELEVVSLVGEGLTNREVAERLYISARTVETHMTHVFAKLGLSSRLELRAEMARRQTGVQGPPAPPTAPGAGRVSH